MVPFSILKCFAFVGKLLILANQVGLVKVISGVFILQGALKGGCQPVSDHKLHFIFPTLTFTLPEAGKADVTDGSAHDCEWILSFPSIGNYCSAQQGLQ